VQTEPAGNGLAFMQKLTPLVADAQLKPAGQATKGDVGFCGRAGSQTLSHTLMPKMSVLSVDHVVCVQL
jgi:hypothetical protein